MALVSKPVAYGLGALVVGALIYYFQDDSPPTKKTGPVVAARAPTTIIANDFRPEDFTTRFARLKEKPRNLFQQPEIGKSKAIGFQPATGHIVKVPALLADGDPNWVFTGIAIVDDTKMALLENGSKHLAEYATEGQPWKASKIRRISAEGIALVPKSGGVEQVVLRYDASLEKAPAMAALPPVPTAPPNQPVVPPMLGQIGNNLQMRPQGRRGRFVITSPQ